MRSVLVTGGAGFIGTNFVHFWLTRHPDDRVVVLDALTYAGNLPNLDSVINRLQFRFVHGDICDRVLVEQLLRVERIDTVVHFAAESHVDRSIVSSDAFVRTNVLGTHSLLECARQVWLNEPAVADHRFHHVSTDEVYGSLGPKEPPFKETTPYAPNSPYAASKAASDHLVRAYHHTYGLRTSVSNCSNNYGPFQFPEKLVPLSIVNILLGKPVCLYGDGRNVRDWIDVEDHCRGIELILSAGASGQVYNIGARSEIDNIGMTRLLCRLTDELFRERAELREAFPLCPAARGEATFKLVGFVKDRPGHDRRYAIDGGKLEKELGFSVSLGLEAGLRRTLLWYVDNVSWWRSIMNASYVRWIEAQYGREDAIASSG